MHLQHAHAPLRVAVSFDALTAPLVTLLANQRAEEPETPVNLIETTLSEQAQGLQEDRYDLGLFAIGPEQSPSPNALALWQDEIAAAVPVRSPLLAFAEIPLQEAAKYPLVMWSCERCEAVNRHVAFLLAGVKATPLVVGEVRSFELMAILVAAGYGIGFGTKSRIVASRKLDVVMRPLAGGPHPLRTYLTCSETARPPSIERFIRRARSVQPHAIRAQ